MVDAHRGQEPEKPSLGSVSVSDVAASLALPWGAGVLNQRPVWRQTCAGAGLA